MTRDRELIKHLERDIKELCTDLVRNDEQFAKDLWGSFANTNWKLPGTIEIGLGFRTIAHLIADMMSDGRTYIEWYCCAGSGYVRENVKKIMAKRGWISRDLDPADEDT